jgi:hypothetical protein
MAGTAFLRSGSGFLAMRGSNAVVVDDGGDPVIPVDPSQPVPLAWHVMTTPGVSAPDIIPDFCSATTTVDTSGTRIESAATGFWTSPSTWTGGVVPNQNDIAVIGSGHTVTYDTVSNATIACVAVDGGTLKFHRSINTRLTCIVAMICDGGTWDQGTYLDPIHADVTSHVVFTDVLHDTASDPERLSNGLIALDGATVRICGAAKTTFLRTAASSGDGPQSGDSTIKLASTPSGWRAGDLLVIPDTRLLAQGTDTGNNFIPQWEEMTLLNDAGSATITLTPATALVHDHLGARALFDDSLTYLPHVANLTRNVVFRSANPQGTRGHVMLMGDSDVDIRYAQFQGLGRSQLGITNSTTFTADNRRPNGQPNGLGGTSNGDGTFVVGVLGSNQIGRYPLHCHRLWGPSSPQSNGQTTAELPSGPQFTLIGNSICSFEATNTHKWGIVLHNSHWGLITGNVMYGVSGSGLFTEDSNETSNVIDGNFACRIMGPDGHPNAGWHRGDDNGHGPGNLGNEGVGFWFRGFSNYVRNNVSANCESHNYTYYAVEAGTLNNVGGIATPTAQGGSSTTTVNQNQIPIVQFENNEGYGATPAGLTIWYLGTVGNTPNSGTQAESTVKDFKTWMHHNEGIFLYETNHLTVDGLVARNMGNLTESVGFSPGDYFSKDLLLINADIQGFQVGYQAGARHPADNPQVVQDSFFCNKWDVLQLPQGTSGGASDQIHRRQVELRNCSFNGTEYYIKMFNHSSNLAFGDVTNFIELDELRVYDYQQTPGDDFQVFYPEQGASVILPHSTFNTDTETGTARGGSVSTITAATATTGGPSGFEGRYYKITGGTGVLNQMRRVTSHNYFTGVSTITPNWTTAPDNTTTYELMPSHRLYGSPTTGLTNQQNYDTYTAAFGQPVCTAGAISPNTTTPTGNRTKILGFTEDI